MNSIDSIGSDDEIITKNDKDALMKNKLIFK